MSFDFDSVDIYWDDDYFVIDGIYGYNISSEGWLLEGALSNDVPYTEHGGEAEAEPETEDGYGEFEDW